MKGQLVRSTFVVAALILGACALVILEVRVLSAPPSSFWFFTMTAASLGGLVWASKGSFQQLKPPAARFAAVGTLIVFVWVAAVLAAVTIGVNLKFALGGHL
jgi:hypothetical protein